jgi:hypothetical protein
MRNGKEVPMCYEFDRYWREQRAEEARRKALEDERRRKEAQPAKPADKPKEQPQPVPA